MGSSLPNHDAKVGIRQTGEKKNPRADCKLAQKNIEITILYDA